MGTGYNNWSTRWRVAIGLEEYSALDGVLFYGEHYWSSVSNGSSVTFAISTPTNYTCRGRAIIESDEGVTVEFREDVLQKDGAAVNAINIDRTSTNVDHMTLTYDPTVTDEGTQLWKSIEGSASQFKEGGTPGECACSHFKLKSSTTYTVKVTNFSGDASKIKVGWYFIEQPA